MDTASQPYLGFPAPLLGPARRLPLHPLGAELVAMEKPEGVLVLQDNWYPRTPVLVEAIRYQAINHKPEFIRAGIPEQGLWAVHDLDPECAGPVLLALSRDAAEFWKNEVGSSRVEYTFYFVSRQDGGAETRFCDLPIARHRENREMLVSHATGKVAETSFVRLKTLGRFALWAAKTTYVRRHQILLHAAESGLEVLGDPVYGKEPPLYLSQIKANYRPKREREETPLYEGPAYYLGEIRSSDETVVIQATPPSRFQGLLKQLERHG